MAISSSASTEVNAPIDTVYRVVADAVNGRLWQPEIRHSSVLETGPGGEQVAVRSTIDLKIRTVEMVLRMTYQEPTTIAWTQEKGPMKSLVGRWELTPVDEDRTQATVHMTLDLGRALGLVIRGPLVDVLRERLVDSLPTKLKSYVESSR